MSRRVTLHWLIATVTATPMVGRTYDWVVNATAADGGLPADNSRRFVVKPQNDPSANHTTAHSGEPNIRNPARHTPIKKNNKRETHPLHTGFFG